MLTEWKLAAVAVALVFAFGWGYKVADWRLTGKYTAEKLEASQAAAFALADMTDARDLIAGKLSASDDLHSADLRKAQSETNRLRDTLPSGGLRVAATCNSPRLGAQAAGYAVVDSGPRAELDPTARRAYFALRDGIDRASAQLAACQDQLKLRASAITPP